MKRLLFYTLFLICLSQLQVLAQAENTIEVPLGGNAFASSTSNKSVTKNGIENWTDSKTTFKVYVRVNKPGTFSVALAQLSNNSTKSVIGLSVNRSEKKSMVDVGVKTSAPQTWVLKDTGYVTIELKGLSSEKGAFPSIGSLLISGSAVNEKTAYVKNNEGNFYYWGRRGPSVHLSYLQPENTDVEWFYNEIAVPKGEDVIGSYYMANGFAEGYFGIQVNSPTERRILFSVWSPFQTDNPKEIPESHKIKLLKKGDQVYTGEFGNEGSGGQSYLKYKWKTDETYRFLLQAIPAANNYTNYTAYFFDPELDEWRLIASFSRPQTQTYLKRLHSFLENFIPEYGNQTRKVLFGNQWVCDTKGEWIQLNQARFTTDNTGNKAYRMDFGGGVIENQFYLQNCGFFSNYTVPKSTFQRKIGGQKPIINFNYLP